MSLARAVIALVALLAIPLAAAHVPLVGSEHREIDASRSWAFYEELEQGETDVWSFDLQAGERIFILVSVPVGTTWAPDVELTGPTGDVALDATTRIGYEPFTPYASREIVRLDAPAPTTGRYSLVITGSGGPYALGFGIAESFSLTEWITIPYQVLLIHLWQGQSGWLLALPYLVGLVVAFGYSALRNHTARAVPQVAAAGLFLGSGLERALQLGIAGAEGASDVLTAGTLTAILAAVSIALAWGTWRAKNPWALVALGVVSVFLWAGLYVGSLLAISAGIASLALRRRAASPPAA